jgi:hypothetical protein
MLRACQLLKEHKNYGSMPNITRESCECLPLFTLVSVCVAQPIVAMSWPSLFRS